MNDEESDQHFNDKKEDVNQIRQQGHHTDINEGNKHGNLSKNIKI